jgi:hypothetical protein
MGSISSKSTSARDVRHRVLLTGAIRRIHAAPIARFYEFPAPHAAAMAACYHRDVHFTDEVFPDLRGPQAGAMWAMLCARGKDLRVEPSAITADDAQGRARWDAWYTFSGSGRPVHNIIQAEFGFRDGLIVRHVDRFDFQRWARQALGVSGLVLGGTFMRHGITAARRVDGAHRADRTSGRWPQHAKLRASASRRPNVEPTRPPCTRSTSTSPTRAAGMSTATRSRPAAGRVNCRPARSCRCIVFTPPTPQA